MTILGTPGAVRSWTAPTTVLALAFSGLAHFAHIGVGLGGVLTVCRFLGLLAAGMAGVWLLLNSDRIGTLKALGMTLLLFVILGPVVQPWYLSWGLILLAPVALGRLRSLIVGLSMVTAFIELPGGTRLVKQPHPRRPPADRADPAVPAGILTVPVATWERAEPTAGRVDRPAPYPVATSPGCLTPGRLCASGRARPRSALEQAAGAPRRRATG